MTKKVIVVHGGDTYPSYEKYVEQLKTKEVRVDRMKPYVDWKMTLEERLGGGFEVFQPRMPMVDNAEYELWKLWFERVLEAVGETPILVGHSLGAMFLMKYYSEVLLTSPVLALLLVAPEYMSPQEEKSKQTSFTFGTDLGKITENAEKVVMFHSEDDFVVDFSNQKQFKERIPDAEYVTFLDKGHFLGPEFLELLEILQSLDI